MSGTIKWKCGSRGATRGILLALVSLLTTACFFPEPPDIEEPLPERPNVNFDGIQPPVYQVLNVQRGDSVPFTIPFTSVDGGVEIFWTLWGNWNLEGEAREVPKNKMPAASDDLGLGGSGSAPERDVQFNWSPTSQLKTGCNQLTLFITHLPNVDVSNDRPVDFSKTASVVWWVNLDAPLDGQQTLEQCPPPLTGPQSTGSK